ncbi:hypothetical protein [Zobellia barbeyronii]|uniref:Uncharacterized protein n=1 Tax=Zobellia barbeyronii TaxID=2748009 RepID=A0ABS5WHQ4_9FLAO|nr:hypothetical protein [Zobellia barbeyronii]MBT2162792.1 hypothetical protein [Zobellia barbeyronii]
MRSTLLKLLLKKSIAYTVFLGFILLGCKATEQNNQETTLSSSDVNTEEVHSTRHNNSGAAVYTYDFDDHGHIHHKSELEIPILPKAIDSLTQVATGIEGNQILIKPISIPQFVDPNYLDIKSPVADKIVENYTNSTNKEPGGHCLSVSKGRFEQAYKEVHGHLPYEDLPDRIASKFFTPKQVFNLLYVSASEEHPEWRSLPEEYRGKGNAGAIAYAGMGTLVDASGIWSGQLRPGALMQVWRYEEDYEKVVQGVDVKKLDPYGHSFVFISYVRDDKNAIIGLRIADQGFQSYRPLVPRDYEVWWAVNLSI